MEKIINYISRGQGLGIKFLLLFSLIVAVFYAIGTKFVGDQFFVPAAQKAADAFLPIRIEDGVVTEPQNTVKNYTFVLGEEKVPDAESFNLTMDTTVDSLDTSGLKEGLYLTRRALYVVQRNQTRVYELEDSSYFPQGDYTDTFHSVVNWAVVFVGLFGFVAFFILYFIVVIFYATCSYIVSAIFRKQYDFDLRMRLSTLAFIATNVVFTVLGWFGFSSNLIFLLAVLALQALVIKELPGKQAQAAQ